MNPQLVPIIILFVLVAGAYFFIHKHASNKSAHPAQPPADGSGNTGAGSVGGGGGAGGGAGRVEQR